MANVDSPFGLRPVSHLLGLDWSGGVRKCYIPSTDSNAFYIGETVDLAGSADVSGAYPTVVNVVASSYNPGMATRPVFGVIVGFEPDPTDLSLLYRKASTNRVAYVCVDPFVIYEVQGSSNAVIAATSVGLNFCLVATHAGSTATGYSGLELDTGETSTPAANATFPFTLLGAVNRPGNDISLVNAKWHVMVTLHRLLPNYSNSAYFGALGVS